MTRSPVNRRDPSGTRKIERNTCTRMDEVIGTYAGAMARVASGIDEGMSVAEDTDRDKILMRLRDAMEDDLDAITKEWIEETE